MSCCVQSDFPDTRIRSGRVSVRKLVFKEILELHTASLSVTFALLINHEAARRHMPRVSILLCCITANLWMHFIYWYIIDTIIASAFRLQERRQELLSIDPIVQGMWGHGHPTQRTKSWRSARFPQVPQVGVVGREPRSAQPLIRPVVGVLHEFFFYNVNFQNSGMRPRWSS